MDLSFLRFERDAQVTVLPSDLAVLFVGVAARQASSPTAMRTNRLMRLPLARNLLTPVSGAFNVEMAAALRRWKVG